MKGALSRFQERYPILIQIVNWIFRFFVGGLFIFSGFTKGIDPWGTIYKFTEYFGVLGFEVWDGLNLAGVFTLCLVEFITGFCILFGCFRTLAPILSLLIMVLMLPLTLWLAVSNPIADCGCFGDALRLSNWQTFYKNVVLTLGIIWLLLFNKRTPGLIHPYLQWIAVVACGAYILAISWLGYYYQPLIDFRPYKLGSELVEHDEETEESDEDDNLIFVYEKDGMRKEFSVNDALPDEEDGWIFIERYYGQPSANTTAVKPVAQVAHVKNLRFYTEDGSEDVTEEVIGSGRQLILMIPDMSKVSAAKTWKINALYEWCQNNNIEMLATMGGNPREIETWKDISLAEYPIYTSDDTSIEEVVRGNPGLVYVEDGIIKWKSSLKAINIDDFQTDTNNNDPMSMAHDNVRILINLSWIFLGVVIILVFLSFSPKILYRLYAKKNAGRMGES